MDYAGPPTAPVRSAHSATIYALVDCWRPRSHRWTEWDERTVFLARRLADSYGLARMICSQDLLASFPPPVDLRPIHQIKVRSGTESNAQAFHGSTNTIWPDQKPFRLLVSRSLARASTAYHVMDQWKSLGMMGALSASGGSAGSSFWKRESKSD